MKISAFIPARMGSSRFPGKPLAPICGMPMIEHVYKRTAMSKSLADVYICTCDDEIRTAAEGFGAPVVMTNDAHERCTDRVAEAYANVGCDTDIVVIVQGDEPLVRLEMIDLAVAPLLGPDGREIFCTNLARRIATREEFEDPNEVKLVFDRRMRALYFSREPIPSLKKQTHRNWWKQVCIIPFWRETLEQFNSMEPTPLESQESVDMMRVLEHGYEVRIVKSPYAVKSVDTVGDLQEVETIMAKDPVFEEYRT